MAFNSSSNGGDGISNPPEVFDVIEDALSDILDRAEESYEAALQSLDDLKTLTERQIEEMDDIDYKADTSGVDKVFQAPSDPPLPTPGESFIDSATQDDIFNKAAGDLGQVSVQDEHDAVYQASSMGLGMLNAALLKRLDKAKERTRARISEAAITKAIQTGTWLREDAPKTYELILQQYGQEVTKEGERRGWSQMQIDDITKQAENASRFAFDKVKAIIDVLRETEQAVAQLTVGMTQALHAAANFSMSGSGSVGWSSSDSTSSGKTVSWNYSGDTEDGPNPPA